MNAGFITASASGDTSMVKMLLTKGADINYTNEVRWRGGGHGSVRVWWGEI